MSSKPVSANKMKKEELIFALHELDVDINPKWTVEELRSLLREQREIRGQTAQSTGLTNKNLAQLTEMATRLGMRMPTKPTRGLLMRMIRDMDGNEVSDETVVTFGRFHGFVFKDIPNNYLDWAIQEVEASAGNADPCLTQLANWAAARKARKAWTERTGKQPVNPEVAAKIKPPPMDTEAVVVAPARALTRPAKVAAQAKAAAQSPRNSMSAASTTSFEVIPPATGTKSQRDQQPTDEGMPTEEATQEVRELETRLAMARQKHGMTATHQPGVSSAAGGAIATRIASDDELANEAPARTRARATG
jgi:uncharacterized protein (DUF3820 family)